VGWDNVPMHRWAQSQIFRSLCFLLSRGLERPNLNAANNSCQLLMPETAI
jgi:hypothetical protein